MRLRLALKGYGLLKHSKHYLLIAGREQKDTRMHKGQAKKELKRQLSDLFRSMDFVSKNFLDSDKMGEKEFQRFFRIYQQLGLAWELLGLQCKHWDGYKKTRDKREACKICGKIKGVEDSFILLPKKRLEKLRMKAKPNLEKTFRTKKHACSETVPLGNNPKFIALIERSRLRRKSAGGVSSEGMRRRLEKPNCLAGTR